MKSRFVRGFVAGVIAAVLPVLSELVARDWLHISRDLFRDFMDVLIFGHSAMTMVEKVAGQVFHFGFMGLIGCLFALFLGWTEEDDATAKCMILAGTVWFAVYAFGTAFRIPVMHQVDTGTALVHLFDALVFGALWPPVMGWLESRRAK